MRDITNKTDGAGDVLTAGDFNSFNDELENLVRSSGETLDLPGGPDNNLFMIAQTIATYAASTYEDTGAADVYVLDRHDLLKDPKTYFDGMQVSFKAIATNTGASTVDIASLGVKSIVRQNGSALSDSNITAELYSTIVYDSALGKFILQDRSTIVETMLNKTLTNPAINTPKINEAVDLLATSTELNTMDGILSTTTEMNLLVGALSLIKGINDAATLTNKTISGDNNAINEVDSIKDVSGNISGGIITKVLDIGYWNMVATASLDISHGITSAAKILSITAVIEADQASAFSMKTIDYDNAGTTSGSVFAFSSTVRIARAAGGIFNSTTYDYAFRNRGYIYITYYL